MKQQKILFTGTTSAGKTTLLEHLKEKLGSRIVVVQEVARELLTQQPELLQRSDLQDLIFSEQIRREVEAQHTHAPWILLDRGVPDILAHATVFGTPHKKEWIEWSRHGYDQIYWLDAGDIRFEQTALQTSLGGRDWRTFRDQLDRSIGQTLEFLGQPWKKLSGSIEVRARIVENSLYALHPEGVRGRGTRK